MAVELDRTYEAAVLTAHRRNDRLGPRVVLGLDDEQVDQFALSGLADDDEEEDEEDPLLTEALGRFRANRALANAALGQTGRGALG